VDPDDTRRRRPRPQIPGQLDIFDVLEMINCHDLDQAAREEAESRFIKEHVAPLRPPPANARPRAGDAWPG